MKPRRRATTRRFRRLSPRGFDDAADDAAPPTTRKKQTKTQRLVASMMHSNVATEADALAERLRTGAATTTTTPYSYAGPASERVEAQARRGAERECPARRATRDRTETECGR